jgi:hypothetical protein
MAQKLPSLELLYELSQAERDSQLTHFDALDTKAGIVLGFAGVLMALSGTSSGLWHAAALAASLVAATAAVAAFWPRSYPVLLPTELRGYLTSEETFTRLRVLDTMEVMVNETRQVLEVKARRLKIALICLAAAAGIQAIGAIAT